MRRPLVRTLAHALPVALLAAVPSARLAAQPAAATPPRAAVVARLDSIVTAHRTEAHAAGLTVGVVRGADTLLLRGYGWADSAAGRRADAATVYRVGSITKQFTAAAVLQLVEQKRLALDDPLGRHLPQYPQWGQVTIRELLNHTSGIPSYTGSRTWAARMGDALAPDSVVGFVARDSFDFAPKTKFRYNNSGYVLLGILLEKVTGTPYPALVQQRYFGPLGMGGSGYCPDVPQAPVHAAGYDRRGATYAPARTISMTSPYAAGALCLSVPDFLRWQAALTGGRVVSAATYARMSRSDTLADGKPTGYGWALAPATLGAHRVVQHGGDIPGGSAQQLWLPDDSLRVVVFTNTLGSEPDRLARNLAAAVVGEPLRGPLRAPKAVALPAALRDEAVGRYVLQMPGGRTLPLALRVENGTLIGQAEGPGQGPIPLVYYGDETFGADFDPTMRLRLVREGGKVVRVELTQRGMTTTGPRDP
jgi:CubicO group peptidase (beta-lactamase class C family)